MRDYFTDLSFAHFRNDISTIAITPKNSNRSIARKVAVQVCGPGCRNFDSLFRNFAIIEATHKSDKSVMLSFESCAKSGCFAIHD